MNISRYLTYAEATKSQTAVRLGIENKPNPQQLEAMKHVATVIFDPVREYVGGPLAATSFFRSAALNQAIGGSSSTSQHMKGEAIDIDCDLFGFGHNNSIFSYIAKVLPFDQLIGEYPNAIGEFAWVHVSAKKTRNRGQVFIKLKSEYIPYSQWKIGMV